MPNDESQARIEAIGDQLRAKISSKFQTSTFLAGFGLAVLTLQLSTFWQAAKFPFLLPVSIPSWSFPSAFTSLLSSTSNEDEALQREAVVRDGRYVFVPQGAPFTLEVYGDISLRDVKSKEASD